MSNEVPFSEHEPNDAEQEQSSVARILGSVATQTFHIGVSYITIKVGQELLNYEMNEAANIAAAYFMGSYVTRLD